MAPGVDLMIEATPVFWAPACAVDGHLMVEPLPSFQTLGAAFCRYSVKFWLVPEESERTAMVIAVDGSLTPGLMAWIFGSFQVLIWAEKIPAMTSGLSFRLLTPC